MIREPLTILGLIVMLLAIGSTVATLPSCTAALAGTIRYVTDALAPAIGVTVAGAGAVSVIVVCNGTAWIAG